MYSSLQQKKRICNVNKLIQSKMNERFMTFITTNTTQLNCAGISANPNITMEMILADPTKPWSWAGISANPNLTMEIILANLTKPWFWYGISSNAFIKEKEAIRDIECKKHLAAYKIQTRWRNALVNPHCKVGINRINRDYDMMYNNSLT